MRGSVNADRQSVVLKSSTRLVFLFSSLWPDQGHCIVGWAQRCLRCLVVDQVRRRVQLRNTCESWGHEISSLLGTSLDLADVVRRSLFMICILQLDFSWNILHGTEPWVAHGKYRQRSSSSITSLNTHPSLASSYQIRRPECFLC
jgi:hypothetical protein